MASARTPLPLAVTMGEPAGVGGEILIKAFAAREKLGLPHFFAVADPNWLADTARRLDLPLDVRIVREAVDVSPEPDGFLNVVRVELETNPEPGVPLDENAQAVIESIEHAVSYALAGQASGVVTLPIQKAVLTRSGFRHPGHTEFLAHLCKTKSRPIMMLAAEGLRVVPVTVHVALKDVARSLTKDAIMAAARITHAALVGDFGLDKPRIAVAALNPHGGESGTMGREEIEIIAPAIAALQKEGIGVKGPFPADTLFHAGQRKKFDAVICMYHDQALIPLKTIDFAGGVNVTLGLPIVRTSPDHGTALDIAGQGKADMTSFAAALKLAAACAKRRLKA
ncbi:MAG TPA: 4-hydroxythreonine-4-phosphate dehydrogenase PdxA [Micropepsaceae bacterium]|nr:4-hydroxythreonine-4-phosphate dehydrogenase PdxA [Micropepsaceae bacterium]